MKEEYRKDKDGMGCGLTYDRDALQQSIVDLLDKMDVDKLRMLYLTANVWANRF